MALPINITELIHGRTIESERLEFKQGWNPEVIIRSMCAFANDLHNWGGGYIIIGVTEDNGKPILPPSGIPQNQIDSIQKEIVQLGHQISPNYFPITAPYAIENKHIIVLWCPAGDNRIYDAPTTLGKKAQRQPYIRVTSNSIIAKGENLRRLQELTARIPFDDRINNTATLGDLDLGLIREYLHEIKSDLFEPSVTMPFADLCRTMQIAKGPDEDVRPVNVGLLFFNKEPHNFFPRSRIELVLHHDDSGKSFDEYTFEGPLHKQLRNALSFINTNIITEHVIKIKGQPEAIRHYNYPFTAIEEVLANALYHKSYELGSPIEVQIFQDEITILSYPSPVPPVDAKILSTKQRIIARAYRNRRIGDFLKELKLTEGRGTGMPAIYKAMAANGSPQPLFDTDDSTYVLVTLPILTYTGDETLTDESTSKRVLKTFRRISKRLNNNPKNNFTLLSNEYRNLIEHLALVYDRSSDTLLKQLGENSEKFKAQFGDNQALLIFILALDPKTSAEAASENIGVSSRTIETYMAELKGKVLQRVGPDKGGQWKIIINDG